MSVLLENHLPVVQFNGLNTNKAVDFSGATSVSLPSGMSLSGASVLANGTSVTAGGAAAATFGSTSGVGIYWGSGAPTISAAQGSLYLRTDGSSTSTRAYINSNGSTTWVAVTTAT